MTHRFPIILLALAFAAAPAMAQNIVTSNPHEPTEWVPTALGVLLYDQMTNPGVFGSPSQEFEVVFETLDCVAADDFDVPAGGWDVNEVCVEGINSIDPVSVDVAFWSDAGGLPGAGAWETDLTINSGDGAGDFCVAITPIILTEGTWWLSVLVDQDAGVLGQFFWSQQADTTPINNERAWINPLGGFGLGCTDWGAGASECGVGNGEETDHSFQIYGAIVPVELVSFDAVVSGMDVSLNWATASETNNAGFEVQVQNGEGWNAMGFVDGHGTTTEAQTYSFTAEDLGVGTHTFRLKQIDFDGAFEYHGNVEVTVETPGTHLITSAYPNPFNPQSQFTLAVATAQHVRIEAFNTLGKRVVVLQEGPLSGNATHRFTFDAESLPSGVYLLRVTGETFTATRTMTLLK